MKNIIIIISLGLLISGCATRRKVLMNKQTGERWIAVDNPKEFMTEKELEFLSVGEK